MNSRMSQHHRRAFILVSFLAFLFFATGSLPAIAQQVQKEKPPLEACQENLAHLNQRMQDSCRYAAAKDEVCEDIRGWLETQKRIRADNPTPYPVSQKEMECRSKDANVVGECEIVRGTSTYSPERCSRARREAEQCQNELHRVKVENGFYSRPEDSMKTMDNLKQAADFDVEIGVQQREYNACLEALRKRDECGRLQGQYTSVATACDDIRQKLQAAGQTRQGSSTQSSAAATVRLGPVGQVEDKVNSPVTLKATVEMRGPVPPGTQYGYYWYVNQVFRTSGISMSSYSFKVPNVGLKQVKVRVVRKSAAETKWEPIGEASYDFSKSGTERKVKIGYVNYQKLSGFSVTINGTNKGCNSGFEMSLPYLKGEGDCSFDVTAGPCSISVSATEHETVSFQHTCDKDFETLMTTLPKKP